MQKFLDTIKSWIKDNPFGEIVVIIVVGGLGLLTPITPIGTIAAYFIGRTLTGKIIERKRRTKSE